MSEAPVTKLRQVRFSLRMLFVLMTLVAVGVFLGLRAHRSRQLARSHKIKALEHLLWQGGKNGLPTTPATVAPYQRERAQHRALAEYHIAMQDKYRRATWFPWVAFEVEPVKPAEP